MEYQICAKNLCHPVLLRRRQTSFEGIGQSVLFWREYCTFYPLQALNRFKSSVIFNCKSLFISIKSSYT
jgi:hypothetical protein